MREDDSDVDEDGEIDDGGDGPQEVDGRNGGCSEVQCTHHCV